MCSQASANGVRGTEGTPCDGASMPSPRYIALASHRGGQNCDSEVYGVASRAQNVLFWAAQLAVGRLVQFERGGRAGSICTLVANMLIRVCDTIRPTCLP